MKTILFTLLLLGVAGCTNQCMNDCMTGCRQTCTTYVGYGTLDSACLNGCQDKCLQYYKGK